LLYFYKLETFVPDVTSLTVTRPRLRHIY